MPARPEVKLDRLTLFWLKVRIGDPDECWPWLGAYAGSQGQTYGSFWFAGRQQRAHRIAYEFSHRDLQPGEMVCHTCDNQPCCNPSHLFAGSNADNMRDAGRKVRLGHHMRRMSEPEVLEAVRLHDSGMVMARIAKKYRVHHSTIYALLCGKSWKHLCIQIKRPLRRATQQIHADRLAAEARSSPSPRGPAP